MRLVRSWPSRIPPGRSYVEDGIERLIIENHDYKALATLGDDVLLLEWDIAVGQEDLRHFAQHAAEDLDRVLVGPYRIYADAYHLPQDVWAHRRWDGTGVGTISPVGARPIETGDPVCQLFGLGMAYLPQRIVCEYADLARSSHFGDTEFSIWHYEYVTQDVPICWDVRPVHLHYYSYDLEGATTHA
jgi:hypothetical protein